MLRLAFLALGAMTLSTMPRDQPPLLTWPDLVGRPRPAPDATISYGEDALQQVDVWLPKGAAPFRTVLMVHGGCWTTSIADRTLMNWIADDLRKEGIAVWNIDYRGVDRSGGGYPGTFTDAAAATDALTANAVRFKLDTGRIVALGHSAGGHLALWLAARPKLPARFPFCSVPSAHAASSITGTPAAFAMAQIFTMSAEPPNVCTGITALMPGVVASVLSSAAGSMLNVSGSISTNTGSAPTMRIEFAVAGHE